MVFQIPALFGTSVEETLLYGARLAGRDATKTTGIIFLPGAIVGTLSYRSFFTPRHQIRKEMSAE